MLVSLLRGFGTAGFLRFGVFEGFIVLRVLTEEVTRDSKLLRVVYQVFETVNNSSIGLKNRDLERSVLAT